MAKAKQQSSKEEDPQVVARRAAKILQAAKIEEVKRADLSFADYNPRQMKPENFRKLCDSVKRFGLVDPPVVNVRSVLQGWPAGAPMTVVGGHQRLRAADKVIGSQDYKLRASLIDVDKNVEKALNVALNNAMLMAQFDQAMLEQVLIQLAAEDYSPENAGFTKTELNFLISDASFSKIFGEQEEEESGYVDDLLAMKQAERDARMAEKQKERENGMQEGSRGEEGGEDPEEDEYYEEDEDLEEEVDAEQLVKEDLKKKRKDYYESREDLDAADVMLTICFDDPAQLRRFLSKFQLSTETRYFDINDLVNTLGLDFDLQVNGG